MKVEMLSGVKSELIRLMKRREDLTVKEGAERLSLAASTVRQHLLRLENDGLIECSERRGGVGRPQKVYFLSDLGERLFPSRDRETFPKLLEFLIETGKSQAVERFFQSLCDEFSRELRYEVRGRTGIERLETLERYVKQAGYSPESSQVGERGAYLTLHHCPYESIVGITELPCQCERRSMEELLEAEVHQETSIAWGNSSCRFRLKWKKG